MLWVSETLQRDGRMWPLLLLLLLTARAALAGDWRYGGAGGAAVPLPASETPMETQAVLNVSWVDRRGVLRTQTLSDPGLFARGHVASAAGLLVPVMSAGTAGECTPDVTMVKRRVPPVDAWIALVPRGGCIKVENVWLLNASAVVIYNNDDSLALQKMPLSENRNISGVFITKKRGEDLVKLVANSPYVYLNISVGPTQPRSYNINRTSVLFVSISFIVLMMISLAWLVFYYVQRFRYIHAKDRLSRRLCSAARKALSKIPTKTIKTEDKEMQGEYECCAVCIEPYKVSDVLRTLPCRHEFHKNCIDPWLLEHRTCPMCKMDILKHYGFVFTGSQESILHVEIEEVIGISPSESPEPEPSEQNQVSPRRQIQDCDLQPCNSSGSGRNLPSSSFISEDTTSSACRSQKIQNSLGGFTTNETTDTMLNSVVCKSCGADIVTTCYSVCETSQPEKESSSDAENEIDDENSVNPNIISDHNSDESESTSKNVLLREQTKSGKPVEKEYI